MNCFLEQLETICCLSNLIVSWTSLSMLVLLDLHDLRDASIHRCSLSPRPGVLQLPPTAR